MRSVVMTQTWRFNLTVATLSAAERERLIRVVLDQFRRHLAIDARCLQETTQQQIRRRASSTKRFWGLGKSPVRDCGRRTGSYGLANRIAQADGFSLNNRSKLGRFIAQQLQLDAATYDVL